MTTSVVSKTRPANTNVYGAGDVIGDATSAIFSFVGIGAKSAEFYLQTVQLKIGLAAIPSGMTTMVLHLYGGSPDAIADEGTWVKTSANDKGAYRGSVTLTPAVSGGDLYAVADSVNRLIQLPSGRSGTGGVVGLYGLLVTTGSYTAASGTVYELTVSGVEI
jgi:hypothetical protein